MTHLFDPFDPIGTVRELPDQSSADSSAASAREPLAVVPTRPALGWLHLSLVGVLLILVGRLISLQVVHGSANQNLAEGNRIRPESLEAPRGLILDAAGRPLATNDARFTLQLTPANLPRGAAERTALLTKLAPLVHQTVDELNATIEQAGRSSVQPITVLDDLDHDPALSLKLATLHDPGVAVVATPVRRYVTDGALSHVLGYLGAITLEQLADHPNYLLTSQVGQTGVEATYDPLLRGEPGIQAVEVNSIGEVQRTSLTRAPVPGQTVILGINQEVQRTVADALRASLEANHATAGAAIGLDPRTGTVRFLVSLPAYDNNRFSHPLSDAEYAALTSDPTLPLLNRVIAGEYPPGSTIKPVIASGGLATGVISRETTIDAPAEIRIGDFVFPDWKRHGLVNVERAIAVSSDVFFYAVGGGWEGIAGLGISRLDETLARFRIGQSTEIDLPGESAGLLPTPAWRKHAIGEEWYIGDTYHLAIGQGDLIMTPLQLAAVTAAFANGGTFYRPHVVAATADPRTNQAAPIPTAPLATKVERADVLDTVRSGMRQTVTEGSGRALNSLPLPIAGKTGSAEYGTPNDKGELPTHAWFASFAPYEQPQLAMVVLAEGGGEGNVAAVPVAKTIYQSLIDRHFFAGDGQWETYDAAAGENDEPDP